MLLLRHRHEHVDAGSSKVYNDRSDEEKLGRLADGRVMTYTFVSLFHSNEGRE